MRGPTFGSRTTTGLAALVVATSLTLAAGPAAAEDCSRRVSLDRRIDACARVIKDPAAVGRHLDALVIRGEALAARGRNAEAVEDFTKALALSPGHPEALMGRAEVHLAMKAFDAAAADYGAVLKSRPKSVDAHIGAGYAHLAKGEAEAAVEAFSQALAIEPRNGVALNNRGLAYRKLGNGEAAIRDFTTAVQFHPLYALAYNNRGYAYEAAGDKTRAVQDFRSALAIDPSLTGARDGLVRLASAGRFAEEASQRADAGHTVAKRNCAWCHAIEREGESPNAAAPAFRDIHARHPILALRSPVSRAIATPHEGMPKLDLTEAQIDQIIAYINSLAPRR